GVTHLQYSVGGANPFSPGPSKSALFYVQYENDIENFDEEKERLLEELKQIEPAGNWAFMDFTGGGLGGSKLSMSVYGDNHEEIQQAVGQIQEALQGDPTYENIDSSLSRTYEQYTLV